VLACALITPFRVQPNPALLLANNSGLFCIEPNQEASYNIEMPSSTDARIESIIAKIRSLCTAPFSPQTEAELRKLAFELRTVINQHVAMAKSSLSTKAAVIKDHDPELAARNQPRQDL
jgi:hypothetical protein